jgi:hypothetical protein
MGNLLRQAQEMQRELDRVKQELKSQVVEGVAGGGIVRVKLTADRQEAHGVEIAAEALRQADRGMLEDLVLAALRDALRKAELQANEAMGRVTGGLNLPGLF